ncbi:MAG: SagB/ThcOx family dehydrogenase [Ignavibacteria bacterium]|nr:SagB/ThcOx family dehydrogenase [Ignavibacteria bacterium]
MSKTKKFLVTLFLVLVSSAIVLFIILSSSNGENESNQNQEQQSTIINLPEPRYDSDVSLEKTLLERRSVRDYSDAPLSLDEISQILWAAQGITDPKGYRTAPSAGALYPLELYVVAGNVNDLSEGVYRYKPKDHKLEIVLAGDKRQELFGVSLQQSAVKNAAAVIVFAADYDRTTVKYGDRGIRYVHIEIGHAAENAFLQAVALDLSAVIIGAFYDEEMKEVLNMPEDEQPLLILPVGKK